MTLRATIDARLDITVEIDDVAAPFINAESDSVLLDGLSVNDQLTDTDDPALENVVAWDHTLAGSSDDLDLTAAPLATAVTDTVDLTGSRLLAMKLVAPSTNAGLITLKTAAANGYPLGAGITLYPGEDALLFRRSGVSSTRPVVGGSTRYLTIDGTDSDELKILATFGDS